MTLVLTGLGLVLVIEGLIIALMPNRFEDIVRALEHLGPERRRALGLSAAVAGTVLLWLLER